MPSPTAIELMIVIYEYGYHVYKNQLLYYYVGQAIMHKKFIELHYIIIAYRLRTQFSSTTF